MMESVSPDISRNSKHHVPPAPSNTQTKPKLESERPTKTPLVLIVYLGRNGQRGQHPRSPQQRQSPRVPRNARRRRRRSNEAQRSDVSDGTCQYFNFSIHVIVY